MWGEIYHEIGVGNMDKRINNFLSKKINNSKTAREEATKIFNDVGYREYWNCYNYPWFLIQIQKLNNSLPDSKKIKFHPSDINFDWYKCSSEEDYEKQVVSLFPKRDSIIASNIIKRYDKSSSRGRKKALIILNYRHAFLRDTHCGLNNMCENTGRYLADKYGEKVANVYIMGLAYPSKKDLDEYTVVKDGKWDALFELTGKTDIGFNLKNTPFGREPLDIIWSGFSKDSLLYQDTFTGLVFYKPVDKHVNIMGWNNSISPNFYNEFKRRVRICGRAEGKNISDEDVENEVNFINTEERIEYPNIASIRKKIDKWKKTIKNK